MDDRAAITRDRGLRIDVKAWFFFVRAICDSAYRLLIAALTGDAAPRGGSMSSAAKNERNPVALLLAEEASDWLDWFRNFKAMRDEIKEGVGAGITDLGDEGIGLVFHIFTPQRGLVIDLSGKRTVSMTAIVDSATRVLELLRITEAATTS